MMQLSDFELLAKLIEKLDEYESGDAYKSSLEEFLESLPSDADRNRIRYADEYRLEAKELERKTIVDNLSRETEKHLTMLLSSVPNLNEKESLSLFKAILNNILET